MTRHVSARAIAVSTDQLLTSLVRSAPRVFTGYAMNPAELSRRYVVQLLVDGVPVQVAVADQFDGALADQFHGDGCYGFCFSLSAEILADASVVEAWIANTAICIGAPVDLRGPKADSGAAQESRGVRWIGGLRFCGWIHQPRPDVPKVTALIDGSAVAEVWARTWYQVGGRGEETMSVPAFDLHLPARFADGCVRTVRIVDESGEDLPGSPLSFVAFADGLARTLEGFADLDSERLRGELYDRLIPASLPMANYAAWLKRFPPATRPLPEMAEPVAVVFVGQDGEDRSIGSLRNQTYHNWVATALPATDQPATFDPAQLRQFLATEGSESDLIIFAISGIRLESHAIEALAAAWVENRDTLLAYADLLVASDSGEAWPLFLPAFDYERMLEQGYGAYLFATRRRHLERALALGCNDLFRLFNGLAGDPALARQTVAHVPGALGLLPPLQIEANARVLAAATGAHLQSRGVAAEITVERSSLLPAVRVRRRTAAPSITVIVPTRNHVGLLRQCLSSIAPAVSRMSAKIIVVDNDSSDLETLDYLAAIDGKRARVLRVPGVFNFARLNNIAAAAAESELLCLLNNDIEALDELWLDEMASRIAAPDVGAVGATLLWPSGIIQHAGVVLGPHLGAAHAFTDRMQDDCGYADMLSVARESSAVTAACLMTRKVDYLAVGGMDEIFFPVNFNDVDYCLKLRARGRRVVITPHARLLHLESASRGTDAQSDRAGRMHRELRSLRARWLETIVNDPYYSPLLSLDPFPCSALAWPPRADAARFNTPPRAEAIPPGM